MSAGAVFKIIANDGKADRMIMASELLAERLKNIMCTRRRQGFSDPTPTLVDIEKTHILFVNAHFKPFAALGYEYMKTRTSTGNQQYGSSVQFSIPQFGDFFSDMVVNVELDQTSATVGTVPAFPAFVGADDQGDSTATANVSAAINTTTGVYTKYVHEYVNLNGTVVAPGSPATNFVRYAEYPGQRLFKNVKFEVNGNPLDEYTADSVIFHQKFNVPPHKMTGWKRLVGQEVPVEAYTDLSTITGTSSWPSALADLEDVNGDAAAGVPQSYAETTRKLAQIVNGPQTPKAIQPVLSIWQPLLFWFNKDVRQSIASVSIPFGMRFISIEIEQQNNILFTAPGNLFLRLTVTQTTSNGTNKGRKDAQGVTDVKTWVTQTPVLATNSIIDPNQKIKTMDIYINNIFVSPDIHDIYIRRIGFSLIRVHRYQSNRVSESKLNILLSSLKWPIETIYVGLRPAINISSLNPNQYRDWHKLTLVTDNIISTEAKALSDFITDDSVAFNAASVKHKSTTSNYTAERLVYPQSSETIDTLQLQAHGIVIFSTYKSAFFRDYMAYTYGNTNIVTPEDPGALMLNFCLYPGTYQPSGHMNISRAREFYLEYVSSYVTSNTPADLLVTAKALNFILISDGSAVLRYST